ncbi:hypothetical protein P7K49_021138, partial [Saguinus oedipus]
SEKRVNVGEEMRAFRLANALVLEEGTVTGWCDVGRPGLGPWKRSWWNKKPLIIVIPECISQGIAHQWGTRLMEEAQPESWLLNIPDTEVRAEACLESWCDHLEVESLSSVLASLAKEEGIGTHSPITHPDKMVERQSAHLCCWPPDFVSRNLYLVVPYSVR